MRIFTFVYMYACLSWYIQMYMCVGVSVGVCDLSTLTQICEYIARVALLDAVYTYGRYFQICMFVHTSVRLAVPSTQYTRKYTRMHACGHARITSAHSKTSKQRLPQIERSTTAAPWTHKSRVAPQPSHW